jgi:hypothetical protein
MIDNVQKNIIVLIHHRHVVVEMICGIQGNIQFYIYYRLTLLKVGINWQLLVGVSHIEIQQNLFETLCYTGIDPCMILCKLGSIMSQHG